MTTISESNPSLVSTSETVDTTGIPLEQFAAHHTHQVDHEDHSTLYVLQDDSGGQDQEVWKTFNCQLHLKNQETFLLTVFFFFVKVVEIAIQAIIFNVQCNKSWMYC